MSPPVSCGDVNDYRPKDLIQVCGQVFDPQKFNVVVNGTRDSKGCV